MKSNSEKRLEQKYLNELAKCYNKIDAQAAVIIKLKTELKIAKAVFFIPRPKKSNPNQMR